MGSLERAYINCMRCYQIANQSCYNPSKGEHEVKILGDEKLWTSRNNALEGLENIKGEENEKNYHNKLAKIARKDCVIRCNFFEALIANRVSNAIHSDLNF